MSGRPLQLVFLPKVKSECVAPGVDIVADVALVFGHPLHLKETKSSAMCCLPTALGTTERLRGLCSTDLVHPLKVVAHGRVRVAGIITALHRAVIHGALVVDLRVLLQVALVLKPVR